MTRKPMKRTRTTNGAFDKATKDLADARAGHRCEVCGVGPIEQHHHRMPRRMGGSRAPQVSSVANCCPACAPCHRRIESDREWAVSNGYLVVGSWLPTNTAMVVDGCRVFLTLDGRYEPVPVEA